MRYSINEDRYLLAAAAIIIVAPFLLGGYVYFYLRTSFAQAQAVRSAQTLTRVLDLKPAQPK